MIIKILQRIASENRGRQQSFPDPKNISFLKYTAGFTGPDAPLTFFLFNRGSREPFALLKVARTIQADKKIEAEYGNLVWFSEQKELNLSNINVPRPLGTTRVDTVLATVQSWLKGYSLFYIMMTSRQNLLETAHSKSGLIVKALMDLHRETGLADDLSAQTNILEKLGDALLALDGHDLEEAGILRNDISEIKSEIELLADTKVRPVKQHGDPSPVNFCFDDKTVGLCDWEGFGRHLNPLYDITVYFIALAKDFETAEKRTYDYSLYDGQYLTDENYLRMISEVSGTYLEGMEILPNQWKPLTSAASALFAFSFLKPDNSRTALFKLFFRYHRNWIENAARLY
jgi:phosphotransferase family enzyme